MGHQFPEGSDSFNTGLGEAETLGPVLHVPVSEYVPDNTREAWPWDLRGGTRPCCVRPWVLGFRQDLDAALLPCLSFWLSGAALACFLVLGRELSAQGAPETCFD